ncbi:MAG: crossover junction endodeoxyribonuclease RuvC [candidate division NC10 bacterium]|nr:crossover junction endodeoxyribonuclease RuvC [candidate division NC10 bacterium]
MLVLGVDPGTTVTGYGLVREEKGRLVSLEFGGIITSPRRDLPQRLYKIYQELQGIIRRGRPDCLAVEGLFFAKNVKSALKLGQARGVVLLAAVEAGIEVVEYSPLEVKGAVTGYGGADKSQVQRMVQSLLRLKRLPEPPDAADALALAICHIHSLALKRKIEPLKKEIR